MWRMTNEPTKKHRRYLRPRTVALVMTMATFLCPYSYYFGHEDPYGTYVVLTSLSYQIVIWGFNLTFYPVNEVLSVLLLLSLLPQFFLIALIQLAWIILPMLLFAYQMARLYGGKSTPRRTVAFGFLMAFIQAVPVIIYRNPLPVAFLVGVLIICVFPPSSSWQSRPEMESQSSA